MTDQGERILLIATYPAIATATATASFERLAGVVRQRTIGSEGLILVSQDEQGQVSVRESGDHLGRRDPGPRERG
jgi:arylsulfatase